MNTILNPMGVSTSSGVLVILKKATNSIPRTKVPRSLLGATRVVYWTLLFFEETMAIFGIQPMAMFYLVATLCEGRTLGMVATLEDLYKLIRFPQRICEYN